MLSARRLAKEPWLREQIPSTPEFPSAAGRLGVPVGMQKRLLPRFHAGTGCLPFAAARC